jgi:hypothetical protein
MLYFFVQHKVHRVPGGEYKPFIWGRFRNDLPGKWLAYTRYAFFEWALIFFDVSYDSVAEIDFREAGLQVRSGELFVACLNVFRRLL